MPGLKKSKLEEQKEQNDREYAIATFKAEVMAAIQQMMNQKVQEEQHDRAVLLMGIAERAAASEKEFLSEEVRYQQAIVRQQQIQAFEQKLLSAPINEVTSAYKGLIDEIKQAEDNVAEAEGKLKAAETKLKKTTQKIKDKHKESFSNAKKKLQDKVEQAKQKGASQAEIASLQKDVNDAEEMEKHLATYNYDKAVDVVKGEMPVVPGAMSVLFHALKGDRKGPVNFLALANKKHNAFDAIADEVGSKINEMIADYVKIGDDYKDVAVENTNYQQASDNAESLVRKLKDMVNEKETKAKQATAETKVYSTEINRTPNHFFANDKKPSESVEPPHKKVSGKGQVK